MTRTTRIALLGAALLGVILMWGRLVDGVIFHPSPGADLRPEQVGLAGEDVFLTTEDGVRIHAFWLPAEGATRALLFLHGNAGNASHRLPNAAELVGLGAHVLLLDYRGYGLSEGRPSEAGAYADARAGLAHLTETRGIEEGRIVVFGRSLGGAVAVDLVQDREVGGLILESTFTSVADMARSVLPPAAPFVGGRFDSASKIGADQMALSFYRSFDTPVTVLRPFNTYGPRQSASAVIPTIISQLAAGQDRIRLGATSPTRDLLYVDDAARAFIAAAECDAAVGDVVHVGTGHETSIGDLARMIGRLFGVAIKIDTDETRVRPEASEVERLLCDPRKAHEVLGWTPELAGAAGLEKGLRRTKNWFAGAGRVTASRAAEYCV